MTRRQEVIDEIMALVNHARFVERLHRGTISIDSTVNAIMRIFDSEESRT